MVNFIGKASLYSPCRRLPSSAAGTSEEPSTISSMDPLALWGAITGTAGAGIAIGETGSAVQFRG
jgi:hypothetical protein